MRSIHKKEEVSKGGWGKVGDELKFGIDSGSGGEDDESIVVIRWFSIVGKNGAKNEGKSKVEKI